MRARVHVCGCACEGVCKSAHTCLLAQVLGGVGGRSERKQNIDDKTRGKSGEFTLKSEERKRKKDSQLLSRYPGGGFGTHSCNRQGLQTGIQ